MAREHEALDRIHQVANGLGAVDRVQYADGIPSGAVVQSGTNTLAYPRQPIARLGKIVTKLVTDNGMSGPRSKSYRYIDPAIDVSGRGALGFASIAVTDEQTQAVSTSKYRQDWPYTGMAYSTSTALGSCLLTSVDNTLDVKTIPQAQGTTRFPYISSSVTTTRDVDQDCTSFGTETVIADYDNWGNVTSHKVTRTADGRSFSILKESTYQGMPAVFGLPDSVTETRNNPSGSLSRRVDYSYDPVTFHLVTETVEPLLPQMKVTTSYSRANNAFGLVSEKTMVWRDPSCAKPGWPVRDCVAEKSRVTKMEYDGHGRFPYRSTNATGVQTETTVNDPGTGAVLRVVPPNGLAKTMAIDGFGRVRSELTADGNEKRMYVKRVNESCTGTCPAGAVVAQVTEHFNGSKRVSVPTVVYSDSSGRVLRTLTWGPDGRAIATDQRYDQLGRLHEVDHPRFVDEGAFLAKRQRYDALDRIVASESTNEAGKTVSTTSSYAGNVVTITNPRGFSTKETRDATGKLVEAEDAKRARTRFDFDPFGNLTTVIGPMGSKTVVEYDALGRRIGLRDPDLGWIEYEVDPIGQVYAQTSPNQREKGTYTSFVFDVLGRMTARYEDDLESHWEYDQAPNSPSLTGVGQLREAYTGKPGAKDYSRIHSYDQFARPNRTTLLLFDGKYASTAVYDDWGRLVGQEYQRGIDEAKRFDLRYGTTGHLHRVERGSLVLWQADARDAAGRLRAVRLGNGLNEISDYNPHTARLSGRSLATVDGMEQRRDGYFYDEIGSVTQRVQYAGAYGFQESFDYDPLNRLSSSTVLVQATQRYTFDDAGNILTKSNVSGGALYEYPPPGAARPHAVSRIGGLAEPFSYDANGNMLSGAGRTITWTSFDMPKQITGGAGAADFRYGTEHQRTFQDKGAGNYIVYAGSQEVERKGAVNIVRTYWPMGLGVEVEESGLTKLYWRHVDNLGSVVTQSNKHGSLAEMDAFDAWGKRLLPNGSGAPDARTVRIDSKGYTGHEMLDQLELVHMNGRVYDPLIGRFISADPIIQDPTNAQSYNRYTYVWNNPTNLTDPTGLCAISVTGSSICFKDNASAASVAYAAGMTWGGVGGFLAKEFAKQGLSKQNASGTNTVGTKDGTSATQVASTSSRSESANNGRAISILSGGGAAERNVEQHRAEVEGGNGKVYDPLQPLALAATSAMLGGSGYAYLATSAAGRAALASLGVGLEAQSIADGVPYGGGSANLAKGAGPAAEVAEIGVITTRTTRNSTRLGGQAGEPGLKITYKNGTEFDMTATRVKQTELNPYVPGGTRPIKFPDATNKQGTKRAPTAEELKWFNSLDWK